MPDFETNTMEVICTRVDSADAILIDVLSSDIQENPGVTGSRGEESARRGGMEVRKRGEVCQWK